MSVAKEEIKMNKEEITLIIFGITIIGLILNKIFAMKYKKDMFIEYLKSYKDGTNYISDDVINKLFDIEHEDLGE